MELQILCDISIKGLERIFTLLPKNDTLTELIAVVGDFCDSVTNETIANFDKNIVISFLTQNKTLRRLEIDVKQFVSNAHLSGTRKLIFHRI